MAEAPYTQFRDAQYRGPFKSQEYNTLIEENYRDLSSLYNKNHIIADDVRERFSQDAKDLLGLAKKVEELQDRVASLEVAQNMILFSEEGQIDTGRFDSTEFSITAADTCSYDTYYGLVTLPSVSTSSTSKLAFVDSSNAVVIPPTLETRVQGKPGTADSTGAVIDTSEPELAVARSVGRIWERNVIVDSPNGNGAEMTMYMRAPVDLFTTDVSNTLMLNPFPLYGVDIIEVAYTTNPNNMNDDQDEYTVFNSLAYYDGETRAVGNVPPGGWTGDVDLNAGPRIYYFDPKPITGLRVKLRQRHYIREGAKYIYSYGLSSIDLRQTKFMSTGKTIIRFDAPEGETISDVTDVIAELWNVAEWETPGVFSWRAIWETSYNSGVYTLDSVSFSKRVWIEITLNSTSNKGTPALSTLSLQYS